MKRFLAVFLIAAMTFCLWGCNNEKNVSYDETDTEISDIQTQKDEADEGEGSPLSGLNTPEAEKADAFTPSQNTVKPSNKQKQAIKQPSSKSQTQKSKDTAVSEGNSVNKTPRPKEEKPSGFNVSLTVKNPDGTLADTSRTVNEGESVLDVLVSWGKEAKISVVYSGIGKTAYVEGINNLFEFDMGAESGWMYKVNGTYPSVSCGAYKLSDGDKVEFIYTTKVESQLG